MSLTGFYRVRFATTDRVLDRGVIEIKSDGTFVGGDRLAFYTGNINEKGYAVFVVRRHSDVTELPRGEDILMPLNIPIEARFESNEPGRLIATIDGYFKPSERGEVARPKIEVLLTRIL